MGILVLRKSATVLLIRVMIEAITSGVNVTLANRLAKVIKEN